MIAAFYKVQHGDFHLGWNASLNFPSPLSKSATGWFLTIEFAWSFVCVNSCGFVNRLLNVPDDRHA